MSANYLYRVVDTLSGRGPKSWIDYAVVIEAKRLLLNSTMSVEDVGHAVGYENFSNFDRTFLRVAGMTPSEWRGLMR